MCIRDSPGIALCARYPGWGKPRHPGQLQGPLSYPQPRGSALPGPKQRPIGPAPPDCAQVQRLQARGQTAGKKAGSAQAQRQAPGPKARRAPGCFPQGREELIAMQNTLDPVPDPTTPKTSVSDPPLAPTEENRMQFSATSTKRHGQATATLAACALTTFAFVAAGLLIFSAPAGAALPASEFWQRCDSGEPAGEQCQTRGVAADPSNGLIYAADYGNDRIVQFSAWGTFLRAWGWDVVSSGPGDTGEGEFEICVPADGDVCKAGSAGGAAGQLAGPAGVALDSAGEVYVAERTNRRIQKFSSDGDFVFAAGRDVVFDLS